MVNLKSLIIALTALTMAHAEAGPAAPVLSPSGDTAMTSEVTGFSVVDQNLNVVFADDLSTLLSITHVVRTDLGTFDLYSGEEVVMTIADADGLPNNNSTTQDWAIIASASDFTAADIAISTLAGATQANASTGTFEFALTYCAVEPGAQQPVVQQPAQQQPAAQQPAAQQPVAQKPPAQQPVWQQPIFEQPIFEQPVTQEQVAEQPAAQEQAAVEEAVEQVAAQTEQAVQQIGRTTNQVLNQTNRTFNQWLNNLTQNVTSEDIAQQALPQGCTSVTVVIETIEVLSDVAEETTQEPVEQVITQAPKKVVL